MSVQRSKADLLALFPTNKTRSITAANVRDFIESCQPSYGSVHFTDPGAPTIIATPATFTKAGNASVLMTGNRFDMPVNNRMRYQGTVPAVCNLLGAVSFNCAANNQILGFAFAINGAVYVPSIVRTKLGTGTDIQAASIIAQAILNPGDYAELWISNDTSASNITIDHGIFQALGFLS